MGLLSFELQKHLIMIFSKQIKSLDRKFFFLRKHISIFNRLYNQLAKINVNHSFHSAASKKDIQQKAQEALQKLLAPTQQTGSSTQIPKVIWAYWHSGFENAPEVVGIRSWQHMNPDYEVKLLSNNNLCDYLDFDLNIVFQLSSVRCLLPIKADILRLYLLSRYGGVWVDATTFCLTPLKTWLPTATAHCHLFNFKQKNNPTRPIEVWFIASPQGSAIINDVLKQYIAYLTKPRKISLFISGKVSLLEKILTKEEINTPLDPSVSYRAEQHGFMPYFSAAYFFYQALKNHLSEQQLNIFLRQDDNRVMTNNFALTKDPFTEYENAYVSKQTYIQSYNKSELYQRRKAFLMQRLNTTINPHAH